MHLCGSQTRLLAVSHHDSSSPPPPRPLTVKLQKRLDVAIARVVGVFTKLLKIFVLAALKEEEAELGICVGQQSPTQGNM